MSLSPDSQEDHSLSDDTDSDSEMTLTLTLCLMTRL